VRSFPPCLHLSLEEEALQRGTRLGRLTASFSRAATYSCSLYWLAAATHLHRINAVHTTRRATSDAVNCGT